MFERAQIANVAHVYELWQAFAAAINDGDLERWLDLWIDDGIQMPPGAPRRVGIVAIRKGMEPAFDLFIMRDMVIDTEEIWVLGDRAYSHGTFSFELTPRQGGETRFYSGKFLDIMVKQADGSWRIAIICHNYDEPGAESRC